MEDSEFHRRMQRIESLTQQLERCADPGVRAASQELIGALLEMHGVALAKILDVLARPGGVGRDLVDAFVRDDLIASLLLLHGLHPDDLATRVRRALDRVRPFLQSHQRDVELLDVRDGVVRLRMTGSCNACSGTVATLEQAIQQAVYEAAPDLTGLEVEGVERSTPAASPFSLPLIGDVRPRNE